jgi:integrase
MAHIEKRTRGGRVSYRARYRAPDGTERNKTFRRKADAEKFLATVESAKLRGAWTDPAAGRTTLAAWLEEWWGSAADLRPSTVARDEAYFNSLILPRFGGVPLAAIRQPDVQAWVAELSARGFRPATVVKAYQLLGRTMTAAVNADMVPRSPCRAVRLPKVEREEMRFLNPAEVARLANVIDSRYRALVLVAAYGGLRIGELAGLRRRRIDLLRSTVDVAEIVVEVRGELYMGPPKTRAGRRIVTLPRSVVEELAEHLGPVGEADAWVFTADKGGVLRPSNFRVKVWLPAIWAAGLVPLRPHDLRHTAVALWIAAGANPKEVRGPRTATFPHEPEPAQVRHGRPGKVVERGPLSVRAGHTSVAFTPDRYGHLFPGHDDELRDRLDAMHAQGLQAVPGGAVVELPRGPSRPVAAPARPTAKQANIKARRGSGPELR